jgi:hypothetical protein
MWTTTLLLTACSQAFLPGEDRGLRRADPPSPEDTAPAGTDDSAAPVDTGHTTDTGGHDTAAPGDDTGAAPIGDVTLYLAVDGADTNDGRSPDAPLASLQGAHDRLAALDPTGNVDILVAPGTYYCRGLADAWTFHKGAPISLRPTVEVPGPAKDEAEHADRPVFEGRDADGNNCADSVWFQLHHSGTPTPFSIQGFLITRYRGAISIVGEEGITADPDLGVTVHNVAFQRIGDKYHYREHTDGTWLEGKGAILLTRSSGCTFTDNWFDNIRNVEGSEGLIHAIYFTSRASRHLVSGNTFHGCTGAMIKLTDYSNENQFLDNQMSYAPHGLRDRWCGADEDPEERCDGDAQCPSWENYFPTERNTWGNLDAGDPVTVLDIPDGQTCDQPSPASNVRMDLGEGGKIYGP